MSTKKSKHKSLSEKVAESFIPRPLADPEYDSDDETTAKFAVLDENDDFEKEENFKLSSIRKQNVKMLSDHSEKYRGKISSRDEFESEEDESVDAEDEKEEISKDDDQDGEDDHENMENDLEKYRKKLKNCQIDSENRRAVDEESSDSGQEDGLEEEEDSSQSEGEDSDYDTSGEVSEHEEGEEDLEASTSSILKESNKSAEIQKGLAVQNQLNIWEKLLEVRIHSQKMLFKANSLPIGAHFSKLSNQSEEFSSLVKETTENVQSLIDKMLDIQSTLGEQYSETKGLLNANLKRPHSIEATNANGEPCGKRFAQILERNFDNFRPYRNSVLQKWHDRTKILTPGAGTKAKSMADHFDVIKKIEHFLLNKNDLIKKSQTIQGNYKLFGRNSEIQNEEARLDQDGEQKPSGNIVCSEIYDDTDFYHQQLRELIEFKTNTSSNPVEMTKQFAELQKIRHKMKKIVDTRASKGRKIRYVVHNKLVNFMAPNQQSDWTEESKTELYRSLFAT